MPALPVMETLTPEQTEALEVALDKALEPRDDGRGGFTWKCEGDHRRVTRILGDLGLSPRQVEAAVSEMMKLGGCCDCEVMFNVFAAAE